MANSSIRWSNAGTRAVHDQQVANEGLAQEDLKTRLQIGHWLGQIYLKPWACERATLMLIRGQREVQRERPAPRRQSRSPRELSTATTSLPLCTVWATHAPGRLRTVSNHLWHTGW